MSLRLYFDVHIPSAVLEGLRRRGIDVLTSQTDGTRDVSDEALLQRATELSRLLFTQDTDFFAIARAWQASEKTFAGIVYAAQQGVSIGQLIDDLELLVTCAKPEELANRLSHLPLQ